FMQRTSLYEMHKKAGAKLVDFHHWEMPIHYSSIKDEVLAVRNSAGIFDISHMGQVFIHGEDAEKFINYIITNTTFNKMYNSMVYTVMCNDKGGVIDDLVVYKFNENKFLCVVNAGNVDKDFRWMKENSSQFNVKLTNNSGDYSMLAVQGPNSIRLLNEFFPSDVNIIKYYNFVEANFGRHACILSRSGYTGETGYEIIVKNESARDIWQSLLDRQEDYGLVPCGLGARDVLRIEAGFPLYGQEISDSINPFESSLNWVVKLNKEADFIGRQRLKEIKDRNDKARIGFVMELNKVARENSEISGEEGGKIGYVTSGTFSFNLGKSIGMGLVQKKNVAIKKIKININDKFYWASIKELPFVKKI
ncbi:MAG: glycine cleavage system aminomethyltransferase GcvT, partial [bacterium]|nr:glycine cleavage system aminomethyltransferase GcvT [bacterium]